MSTMTDAAAFIRDEMITNAGGAVVATIRALNHQADRLETIADSTGPFLDGPLMAADAALRYRALTTFKAWVGNRRPWDHKATMKTRFGEWTADAQSKREYNFDIWSNVHYGFVGRACGFSEWTLKAGAGYAQWQAGTAPDGYWERRLEQLGDADFLAAFDDPADQRAIKIGMDLWNAYGPATTSAQLVGECRTAAAGLNTRVPAR